MALTGELEFYAAGSGLPATATLAEHQVGYWRAQLTGEVASDTHNELEHAFYLQELATTRALMPSLIDARKAYFRAQAGHDGAVNDLMIEVFAGGGEPPDVTAPTAGTLASSSITDTTFTLTVSGAADETALHAQPYRFSTDNGSSWSAWQTSPVFNVTGKTASTGYTCVHQTRDAALNTSTGSSILVTTGSGAPAAFWATDVADYPGSGTTIEDSVGAVDLLFNSSPVYQAAAPEYMELRKTISSRLQSANDATLDLTAAQSFEAWVRMVDTGEGALLSRGAVTGSGGWMLWWTSGQVRLYVRLSARVSLTVPTGVWTHIVGVLDGTNAKLYRDGVEAASAAYTGFPASVGSVPILAGGYLSSPNFFGNIDYGAGAVYNEALDPTEVTALFNAKRSRFGL